MPTREEYWSGKFTECPNCESTESGTIIYKCKESLTTSESDHCGKVFCNECGGVTLVSFGGGGHTGCPSCDSFGSMIGKIKTDSSSDDSDDDSDDDYDYSYSSSSDDSDYSSSSYDSSPLATSVLVDSELVSEATHPIKKEEIKQEHLSGRLKVNPHWCNERVNLNTGVIEERHTHSKYDNWKPRLSKNSLRERVDFETGIIEEHHVFISIFNIPIFWEYTNRFRIGNERIDMKTGMIYEKLYGSRKLKINENGVQECLNLKTGLIEEPDWKTAKDRNGKPKLNENGKEERVCPDTGVFQEHDLTSFFWSPKLNKKGYQERNNITTGQFEVLIYNNWVAVPRLGNIGN